MLSGQLFREGLYQTLVVGRKFLSYIYKWSCIFLGPPHRKVGIKYNKPNEIFLSRYSTKLLLKLSDLFCSYCRSSVINNCFFIYKYIKRNHFSQNTKLNESNSASAILLTFHHNYLGNK